LLSRRERRTPFDPGVALLAPAGILHTDLTDGGRVEHPEVTDAAVSDMGDHVAERPARQPRRLVDVEGVGGESRIEIDEEPSLRLGGNSDPGRGLDDVWHVASVGVGGSWQSVGMQLGMIGLGRMGANMVRRLHQNGHDCVVYDVDEASIGELEGELGVTGARTLTDFVAALDTPRAIWVMVPAAFVGDTVDALAPLLDADDIIIDGGNSWYRHDVDRANALLPVGVHYLDVGTSGGVYGLERGYSLMIGGPDNAVERLTPIFESLAPGLGEIARTPGRADPASPEEHGWLHCGPSGAGHFVKMVHNGIEYGLMAAYAEGLNVLAKANIGAIDHGADAETAPLDAAPYYRYDFDLARITEVWRRGSVISSWLLDLTAEAFHADPGLSAYAGVVSDSGEGRWTINAAIDEGVPVPVLSAALFQRFSSRGRSDVADQVLSAMRAGFGGHIERKDATR